MNHGLNGRLLRLLSFGPSTNCTEGVLIRGLVGYLLRAEMLLDLWRTGGQHQGLLVEVPVVRGSKVLDA